MSLSNPPLNLALVRAWLEQADLPPARCRELLSGIDTFCRWCDREPVDLPAAAAELRRRFAELHPSQLGIGKPRFANVKSLVFKAVALASDAARVKRELAPFTPAWRRLHDALPDKYQKNAMAPLMRWAGRQGIAPDQVDEAVSAAYLAHLEATATRGQPRVTHQTIVRLWNRAKDTVPGWPATRLVKPNYRTNVALPWSAFPPSLEAEARNFAAVLAGDDLFDEKGPTKPLKPHTIVLRLGILRRVATALVALGHAPERITDLAYLVVPEHVRAVLRHLHGVSEQPPRALSKVADALVGLARHHLARPEQEVQALRLMAGRLRHREGPKVMSPKARTRLQQFDARRNLAAIYLWPEQVMAEVEKLSAPRRADALRVQTAIAVEILLHAPMRIANLAGLQLGEEVDSGRHNNDPMRIVIAAAKVKNGERLEYELPPEAARRVRLYLKRYRPLLVAQPGAALFPNRFNGTKRSDGLSQQIFQTLWDELGLRMHPHLFRHVAATQHLRRNPGAYETVARVLGHRSRDTAYRFYAGEETRTAVARFDQEVLDLKDELRTVPAKVRRRG